MGLEPKSRHHGLTPEAFETLLARLDPDREQAGQRYEEIRSRLVRLFEWRGCENPEKLADDTFDRVARRLNEGVAIQSADPFSYFCGVAHLVYKEVLRQRDRERRARESEPPAVAAWPPDPEADRRLDCLRTCLQRLPEEQRRLILRYHGGDDRIQARQDLARELGIELNALRIRAHRVRRELEACVRLCLSLSNH